MRRSHYHLHTIIFRDTTNPLVVEMLDNEKKTQELHSQINALEIRLEELKRQLRVTKNGIDVSSNPSTEAQCKRSEDSPAVLTDRNWNWPLEMVEYQRYGRQMIMPEIGLHGGQLCCNMISRYLWSLIKDSLI